MFFGENLPPDRLFVKRADVLCCNVPTVLIISQTGEEKIEHVRLSSMRTNICL